MNQSTPRHFVSEEPFDPYSVEKLSKNQESLYLASQWRLMWWKLKKHRLALISGFILLLFYLVAALAEWFAPYDLHTRTRFIHAPPQAIHLFHEGKFIGPFVYGYNFKLDMNTLKREFSPDENKIQPIRFFCSGDSYRFWGLLESRFHFVCPSAETLKYDPGIDSLNPTPTYSFISKSQAGELFLLGTDRLGRDLLSRIIYGSRISLTIGLVGIAVSFFLGMVIGGLAGYFGGWVDALVQRLIEVLRSFPEIPLWMALSAVLPVTWSPLLIFLGITIILALLDWTGLARAVRSKLMALREEDYCTAAQLMGAKPGRIIGRHLLPGFMSHLIASASLSIPGMILGETALSFLGLGLRPPITSWGVLLNEAQNINVVALYPWLMLPVVPVIVIILAFNFFGDGLRDAADPYKN